jgi:hypothetical protein
MTRTLAAIVVSSTVLSGWMVATAPAQTPSNTGSLQVIDKQSSDEWLASQLKGTTVLGADNQKIGDITDILCDKSGQVRAFVIGVGGVLGVGAKEIALDITAFQEVPGAAGKAKQLKIAATKDQIKMAASFTPIGASSTTTGAAPSPSRPLATPGPMAPSTPQ